jgi:hypothetical protein
MGSSVSGIEEGAIFKPKRFVVSKFVQPKKMFQNAELGDTCEFEGLINPNPPRGLDESTDLKRLDPDEEHRIQIQVLTQKSKKEPCPICQIPLFINPNQDVSTTSGDCGKYDKVEHLVMTPCKHIFHEECFVAMFKTNPQCPLCRTDLRDMRNDQFVFEESEGEGSIYLVIQDGLAQYQINFSSPEELLEFIRLEGNTGGGENQPVALQRPRPFHDESISVSISLPDSQEEHIVDPSHSEPQPPSTLRSQNGNDNLVMLPAEPRMFIRTSEGDFPLNLQSNAIDQFLQFRRAQNPAFISADDILFPLMPHLNVNGDGQNQENEDNQEEEYSLRMNSEQTPIREHTDLIHRRNYSLDFL